MYWDNTALKDDFEDGGMIIAALRHGVILEAYGKQYFQFKCMVCGGDKDAINGHLTNTKHQDRTMKMCTPVLGGMLSTFNRENNLLYHEFLENAVNEDMVHKYLDSRAKRRPQINAQPQDGAIQTITPDDFNRLLERIATLETTVTTLKDTVVHFSHTIAAFQSRLQ